jgi:hypothetical protein
MISCWRPGDHRCARINSTAEVGRSINGAWQSVDETGVDKTSGKTVVRIGLSGPLDGVDLLIGDASAPKLG